MKRKPLIVGIDPGTTTALAFLDVNGEVIDVESGKNYGKRKLIKKISEKGNPMIIGTDKSSLPSTMKEVVTKFKCKVVTPEEDLTKEKKNQFTEEHRELLDNDHEKDALAAAIHAYKSNRKTLRKIKEKEGKRYEEVVRKKFLGIKERKKEKKKAEEHEKTSKKNQVNTQKYEERTLSLQEKIKELKEEIQERKRKSKEQKTEISTLKEERGITEREAYLQSRINKLKREKEEIEDKLKTFIEAHDSGQVKKMKEKQMKRTKYTENEETFDKLKKRGEEAYLVKILHETDNEVYYREKDHCKPEGNIVKDMIQKYRETRK